MPIAMVTFYPVMYAYNSVYIPIPSDIRTNKCVDLLPSYVYTYSRTPPNSHLVYSSRSPWPRLHSHSGLYFRNTCYAATSLLRITAITSPPTKHN